MIILAADTDAENLRALTDALQRIFPAHAVVSFRDPLMVFPFALNNRVDMAFLGLTMPRANGSETADVLRRYNPDVSICVMGRGILEKRLARRQGFTAFAEKPVTESRLRLAIGSDSQFARHMRAGLLGKHNH